MMFVVILFKVENAVAIVPTSWMGEGKIVKWPKCSVKIREKLAREGKDFNGKHDKFPVSIRGMAASYEEAQKIEKITLEESKATSLNDTISFTKRPKRNCKMPKRIVDALDDSTMDIFTPSCSSKESAASGSEDDDHKLMDLMVLPTPPHPASMTASNQKAELVFSLPEVVTNTPVEVSCLPGTSQTLLIPTVTIHSPVSSGTDKPIHNVHQCVSVRKLNELKLQLDVITKIVTDISKRQLAHDANRHSEKIGQVVVINDWAGLPLPLASTQELANFQRLLLEEDVKKSYISAMSSIRCDNVSQFIRTALSRTFETSFASEVSLSGQNGKVGLKDTSLMSALDDCLQGNPQFQPLTRLQLHQVVRDWLHNSRHRNANAIRKSNHLKSPDS